MNLPASLKVTLRPNVALASYTTMHVGGPAQFFAEPKTEAELIELLEYAHAENLKYCLLGKGSNLIFPDEGYPGIVISFLRYEQDFIDFDLDKQQVSASSGIFLYRLVLACRNKGLSGMEFLANIPGTVGGATVMNAGFSRFAGQKNEIADILQEVTFWDPAGGKQTLKREELDFSYRQSSLNDKIVLSCKFQLVSRNPEQIQKEIEANFSYRNTEQDLKHPSSGSIFKNPPSPHPSAGRLIDQCGLKGVREGGIQVSEKHGNYFINVNQGKARDVQALIRKIQKVVFDEKGIQLEPEVRFIQS